jgi:hypothetical protein
MDYAILEQFIGFPAWILILGIVIAVVVLAVVFLVLSWRYSLRTALASVLGVALFAGVISGVFVYVQRQAISVHYMEAEDQARQEKLVQHVSQLQAKDTSAETDEAEPFYLDAASLSKQELIRKINIVERALQDNMNEVDDNISLVKQQYDKDMISNYDEMTQIAQLEIHRRDYIVNAMKKKTEYVDGASFLEEADRKEMRELFYSRAYQAEQERNHYESVLAEVKNHSSLYQKLSED